MTKLIIGALTGLGLAAGNLAIAQQQAPQTPPPQQPQQPQQPSMPPSATPSTEVSSSDIHKFAEIYVNVEETRKELSEKMNEAGDRQEAQEIQAEMHDEIVSTIKDHGWSLNRYNQVATAINEDPQLRQQAIDAIEQLGS